MVVGENGIISKAAESKEKTKEAGIIENITQAYASAQIDTLGEKVTVEDMQKALDGVFGENVAEAIDNSDTIVVKIEEKYYEIDSNGNVGEGKTLEPIEYAGDITKGGKYDGTSTKPYRIECIEDLVALSKIINSGEKQGVNVVLVKDLDFNSIFSYSNYKATYKYDSSMNAYIPNENGTSIKELCTTGQGFIPIGYVVNSKYFSGKFDGSFNNENHKIENIYINCEGNAGLFGVCFYPTIKNLEISGNIISTRADMLEVLVLILQVEQ